LRGGKRNFQIIEAPLRRIGVGKHFYKSGARQYKTGLWTG
jgi:hypothetical protein